MASHSICGKLTTVCLAMLVLLAVSPDTTNVLADLPVHCTIQEVVGTWTFLISRERHTSFASCPEQLSSNASTISIHLQLPNIAIDHQTGRNGTFTMVYDEGMEIRFEDRVLFAFFSYTSVRSLGDLGELSEHQNTAKQTFDQWFELENNGKPALHETSSQSVLYVSMCHATSQGWYSRRGGHVGSCVSASKKDTPAKASYVSSNGKTRWVRVPWDETPVVSRRRTNEPEDGDQKKLLTSGRSKNNSMHTEPAQEQEQEDWVKIFVDSTNQNAGDQWSATEYDFLYNLSLPELQRLAGFIADEGEGPVRSSSFDVQVQLTQDLDWRSQYPDVWDWRDVNGIDFTFPVTEQGSCGSCFAVSAIDMIQTRIAIQTANKRRVPLSVQEIVSCSPFAQGCGGGLPYLSCKTAQELGVGPEGCFPYRGEGEMCVDRTVGGRCDDKVFIRDYAYVGGFYGAGSEEAMMKEIMEHGPVAVAVDVHSEMLTYHEGIYSRHEIEHGRQNAGIRGWEVANHAMLCVGWGEDPKGNRFWIVKNSWGEDWGEQGFIRILRGVDAIHIESMAVAAYV